MSLDDTMVARCADLLESTALTEFERGFLTHAVAIVQARGLDGLSINQLECFERIHKHHFERQAELFLALTGGDAEISWPVR